MEQCKTVTPKSGSNHEVVVYMEFQLQVFHWEVLWCLGLMVTQVVEHGGSSVLIPIILPSLSSPYPRGNIFNKGSYREAPPEVQPLTILSPFSTEKVAALLYTFYLQMAPLSHTQFHVVQNFASLLTAVSALSLKYENITKPEQFLDFFHCQKNTSVSPFGLLYRPK